MDVEPSGKVSSVPGIIVSFFLFLLTVLAWPGFFEKMFSFDWQLGNMRPAAYVLEALLGSLTLASLLARGRINSSWARWFPTRKRLLFALVALSLSSIASLLVAEVALRLLDLPFEEKWAVSESALAQFDPELGWTYIPNRSVVQTFGTEHIKVAMHFDEFGFRVRSPGEQHDPAAPTALFVGDSFTFGHGVPYEETFVGRLASMPEFPLQAINLGVQAYGTDQSLLLLKRYFHRFNTKLVVYTFISEQVGRNAVYDVRVFHPRAHFLGTKPLFALSPGGTLYLKRRPVRFENLTYSRLWACTQIALVRWGPKPGFELTRALVREMKNYVESNGATFIVIDWHQRPWKSVPRDSPFWGMNLNLIDTGASPPPDWNNWKIPGDGHPDARAHLYVAGLLFEELQRTTKNWQNLKIRGSGSSLARKPESPSRQ